MVAKNYTLTRVTSGEQDLEWDTNANKYVLSVEKSEQLYAITVNWYRDPSKDIINKSTLYTDSTTLVEGTTLYNNLGEDSGLKVGTVNPDGSFEIESESDTYTLTINCTSGLQPSVPDFIVTDIENDTVLYTASDLSVPATVTIDFPRTSTIKISNLVTVTDGSIGPTICYGIENIENCTETHDNNTNDGDYFASACNNIILSNFTGDPTITLIISSEAISPF